MKTKNIFKTLVLAAVLVSACGKNEIADDFKGYTLPVTVNVSRQGDDATKATYTDNGNGTGSLAFSAGDKLFVAGDHTDAGSFAGALDYDAVSGNFSGTVTTQNEYTGTIDGLMAVAEAVLLPADYGSYGFFSVSGSGYEATVTFDFKKAFALKKAAAVVQFSEERAFSYSSGFALAPQNAILNFTISGLTANKEVAVSFDTDGTRSGNVTTSATGVATFAVGVYGGCELKNCTLTVDGYNIAMPTKEVEAGHIYNISRSMPDVIWNSTDISSIDLTANSIEIRGITFACDDKGYFSGSFLYSENGNISFTSSLGKIKKIEINHSGLGSWYYAEEDGWLSDYDVAVGGTFTWEGTPTETVKLSDRFGGSYIESITSIGFTLE